MHLAAAKWAGCGTGVGILNTGVWGKAEGTLEMVWLGGEVGRVLGAGAELGGVGHLRVVWVRLMRCCRSWI